MGLLSIINSPINNLQFHLQGSLLAGDERILHAPLLGELRRGAKKDLLKRNLIRHDSKKLASELMKIVDHL